MVYLKGRWDDVGQPWQQHDRIRFWHSFGQNPVGFDIRLDKTQLTLADPVDRFVV
jgi:hypothetical protein